MSYYVDFFALRYICMLYLLYTLLYTFALETGRYRGVVEEERVCIYCDIHDIENEFHFMFYCPLYHELRQKLFSRCKNLDLIWLSDADRLCWIFENKIFALAEYLEKAWDKRSKITYI